MAQGENAIAGEDGCKNATAGGGGCATAIADRDDCGNASAGGDDKSDDGEDDFGNHRGNDDLRCKPSPSPLILVFPNTACFFSL